MTEVPSADAGADTVVVVVTDEAVGKPGVAVLDTPGRAGADGMDGTDGTAAVADDELGIFNNFVAEESDDLVKGLDTTLSAVMLY